MQWMPPQVKAGAREERKVYTYPRRGKQDGHGAKSARGEEPRTRCATVYGGDAPPVHTIAGEHGEHGRKCEKWTRYGTAGK